MDHIKDYACAQRITLLMEYTSDFKETIIWSICVQVHKYVYISKELH